MQDNKYKTYFNYMVAKLKNSKKRECIKKRKLKHTLTIEQIMKQIEKQNYKCFYTNEQFTLVNSSYSPICSENQYNPSIDRVDPDIGYVKENIVICTQQVNVVKNYLTHHELIILAKKLIKASAGIV